MCALPKSSLDIDVIVVVLSQKARDNNYDNLACYCIVLHAPASSDQKTFSCITYHILTRFEL